MEVKKIDDTQITNAIDLIWQTFLQFEAPDYSEEGVKSFQDFIENKEIVKTLEFWGAYDEEELKGVIATNENRKHICCLVWVPSRNLSVVISFLMVAPIVYQNVLGGISNMDHKLTEMADVFQVPFARRLRYLYLPQVAPFFRSACAVGLGLCWKSGVAAEVIGLPDGSIGERLYEAKVYLDTPDLFAWTLVIVLVSIAFEKLFLFLLDRALYLVRRP